MDFLTDSSSYQSSFPLPGTPIPYDTFEPVVQRTSDGTPFIAGWLLGTRAARIETISAVTSVLSGGAVGVLFVYLGVSRACALVRPFRRLGSACARRNER